MRAAAFYLCLAIATAFGVGMTLTDFLYGKASVLCGVGFTVFIVAALLVQPMAEQEPSAKDAG